MYHRRQSTSSDRSSGPASSQHQYQRAYPMQRAKSLTASQFDRSYDGPQFGYSNNTSVDTSYSSLPDTDENYHGSNYNYNNIHSDDNDKYKKRNNRNGSMSLHSFLLWRVLPCLVLVFLPWIPNHFLRRKIRSKKTAIDALVKQQKNLVDRLDETTESIQKLKHQVEFLHKDNDLSFQELKRHQGKSPDNLAAGDDEFSIANSASGSVTNMESEAYANLEAEEEVLMKRIDTLERSIQKSAISRLIERYGYGKYRFKVNVRDSKGVMGYFVIETAMLAEMPHSIDHFFKMVENNLWNGLALVHDPGATVISATPMLTDETHTWAGKRFVDANLTHMAFTEHCPTYPPPHHRKFTVAFSGRPGGPGFYISLENDLEFIHEHESTFGVVMEGRDVLYRLFLSKEDKDTQRILKIEDIVILPTKTLTQQET